jgi:CTP:molybdopterin cytidylyltransferase MocA/SAM-dependent methyltransferase
VPRENGSSDAHERDDRPHLLRVTAVVLAAGAGSRFGGGKLLARLDGRSILQHVLDHLAEAGLDDVVVVVGDEASTFEHEIDWRTERRVRNPHPARGLSSSLQVGLAAVRPDADAALIVLGDQPRIDPEVVRSIVATGVSEDRPITVPSYAADGGRNPVLLGRTAFALAEATTGDRGLGPLIAEHPDRVTVVEVTGLGIGQNPDVDTQADLVRLLELGWSERVEANKAQVDRFREIPDGTDFYAPVTSLFRADPTRTDEPALAVLLGYLVPGETWLDIGAGAGRYALPLARALAPSGGSVIAVDASAGMLSALDEIATDFGIANVRTIEGRWPPADGDVEPFRADASLIAHVGYDIAAIGPFVAAMEASTSRLCVAMLMERQPSSIADVCWPPVWGEGRVALPALPEFVELLRARGRQPSVERLEREPRRFGSRDELAGFLRRQLWVEPGSAADARFLAALDAQLETDAAGAVGMRDQQPLPIGIVTWEPGGAG